MVGDVFIGLYHVESPDVFYQYGGHEAAAQVVPDSPQGSRKRKIIGREISEKCPMFTVEIYEANQLTRRKHFLAMGMLRPPNRNCQH
jgi:hypothetical protein